MIDTHCHLGDPAFSDDLEAVIARARDAGVSAGLCVLNLADPVEETRVTDLATRWPGARFAVGLHPHEAHKFQGRVGELIPALDAAWARIDACAVGEIGLDYHYDFSPRDLQREVFAAQVEHAAHTDRPIIIHTREADADTVAILETHGRRRVRGVFHCFSGDAALAHAALELGFSLSFSGILTFPKAGALREVAAAAPHDRILLETDCPYLAPVPTRGKRNEPAFVVHTAAVLAEVLGMTVADLDRVTSENAARLFGIGRS